jgi:hypothetical protein
MKSESDSEQELDLDLEREVNKVIYDEDYEYMIFEDLLLSLEHPTTSVKEKDKDLSQRKSPPDLLQVLGLNKNTTKDQATHEIPSLNQPLHEKEKKNQTWVPKRKRICNIYYFTRKCNLGRNCKYIHDKTLFHKGNRMLPCKKYWSEKMYCPYGQKCMFAHNEFLKHDIFKQRTPFTDDEVLKIIDLLFSENLDEILNCLAQTQRLPVFTSITEELSENEHA